MFDRVSHRRSFDAPVAHSSHHRSGDTLPAHPLPYHLNHASAYSLELEHVIAQLQPVSDELGVNNLSATLNLPAGYLASCAPFLDAFPGHFARATCSGFVLSLQHL